MEVFRQADIGYYYRWIISYYEYTGNVPDPVISGAQLTGGATGTLPQISFF